MSLTFDKVSRLSYQGKNFGRSDKNFKGWRKVHSDISSPDKAFTRSSIPDQNFNMFSLSKLLQFFLSFSCLLFLLFFKSSSFWPVSYIYLYIFDPRRKIWTHDETFWTHETHKETNSRDPPWNISDPRDPRDPQDPRDLVHSKKSCKI